MSDKTKEQEAREQECRVRAMARHLLAAQVSNPRSAEEWSAAWMVNEAWALAELFESQAEERWRKLQ